MGGATRTISKQAFNEMLLENIDDLGMDPAEALDDAIQTLTLQGVDLSGLHLADQIHHLTNSFLYYLQFNHLSFSGISTCLPGETNPVVECLGKFKEEKRSEKTVELLDEMRALCRDNGAAIATINGGIEVVVSVCAKLQDQRLLRLLACASGESAATWPIPYKYMSFIRI